MSQLSTSSAFVPINSHHGDGDAKPPATTRLDKQVAAVTTLQSNADVLKDVASLVEDVINVLKPASFKRKQYAITSLNNIKEAVSTIRKKVESDAIVLSPVPSMGYVHSRKRRAISPETLADTTLASITAFNKSNTCKPEPKRSKRPLTNKPVTAKTFELQYPPPANGKQYTTTEAYAILSNNLKFKRKLMLEWIELKYVPIGERGMYMFFDNIRAGAEIPTCWGSKGRRPIATEVQIKEKITSTLIDRPGCSIGTDEIRDALVAVRNEAMLNRGVAPIGPIAKPSASSTPNSSVHFT